jgi:hypothetical protein
MADSLLRLTIKGASSPSSSLMATMTGGSTTAAEDEGLFEEGGVTPGEKEAVA